jgi:hypothetical protein
MRGLGGLPPFQTLLKVGFCFFVSHYCYRKETTKMNKIAQFVIAAFIIGTFINDGFAQQSKETATSGLCQILGIRPDSNYTNIHLATTPKGASITATVDDPAKLSSLGLKGVKKGDGVELMNIGNGKWNVRHLLTRNEMTYHGSPELAVMDFTPPAYKSVKTGEFDVTAGFGKLSGYTRYQIGGTVSTPSGGVEVHFPISELEFPMDVNMVSMGAGIGFAEKLKLSANVKKSITDDAGHMKDSDWGYWWLDGYGWAEQGTLDIYSESDADLDALLMDVNLRYRIYRGFFVGLGYIHQNFDYEISNLHQWYPSYNYYFGVDSPHDRVGGTVLKYEVTYSIPYMEIVFMGKATDAFTVEMSLGYSPIVNVEDEDQHLLRSKVNKGDCDGTAILFSLEGRYDFPKNWFLTLGFDYVNIDTDGKSDAFFYGVYDHTIDLEIESNQVFAGLTVGYAF